MRIVIFILGILIGTNFVTIREKLVPTRLEPELVQIEDNKIWVKVGETTYVIDSSKVINSY